MLTVFDVTWMMHHMAPPAKTNMPQRVISCSTISPLQKIPFEFEIPQTTIIWMSLLEHVCTLKKAR
jgi:hypothetical protein